MCVLMPHLDVFYVEDAQQVLGTKDPFVPLFVPGASAELIPNEQVDRHALGDVWVQDGIDNDQLLIKLSQEEDVLRSPRQLRVGGEEAILQTAHRRGLPGESEMASLPCSWILRGRRNGWRPGYGLGLQGREPLALPGGSLRW